uniref:hypothetical protein n=1 Tax=Methanobrevibacter sp. TaxID=66852 RepID=UPI00386B0774
MRFKKGMLITLILLAILTMGAVSASDNITSDDLAAMDEGDVADASLDDELSEICEENVAVEMDDGDDLKDSDDEITEDNFHYCWVSNRETKNNDDYDKEICNIGVWNVYEGTLSLTITNQDDYSKTYNKTIPDDYDMDNHIVWRLSELDIIDEVGAYNFNVNYVNGDTDISIIEDFSFQLIQLEFASQEGDIFKEYPFDVIRIWDGEANVEIYVNDNQCQNSEENPYGWRFRDLGIDKVGEYNITIKSFDEDGELIEEISYTLNVIEFDKSDFLVFSNFQVSDLDEPALYIYCPDGSEGSIGIYGESLEDEFDVKPNEWMTWTLDDLGIDGNGDHEFEIVHYTDDNHEGEFIDYIYVGVWCFMNLNMDWTISSHESNNDGERELFKVWLNDVYKGTFVLNITNSNGDCQTFEKTVDDADEDGQIIWRLCEVEDIINEYGVYTINLTYINDDTVLYLEESTFQLVQLDFGAFEGDIFIGYPFTVLKIYDEEANVKVYVNGRQCEKEDPYVWTLNDLGIADAGEHEITIESFDDGELSESITYTLFVDDDRSQFRLVSDLCYGVQSEDMDNPVLYLFCPDYSMGNTYTIKINDDYFDDVVIDSDVMSWTLDDLGIDYDDWFNIKIFENEDEGPIAETGLPVECFNHEPIMWVDLCNMDDNGVVYIDNEGYLFEIHVQEDVGSGMVELLVNGESKFNTKIYSGWDYRYVWYLKTLGITEPGEYDIAINFIGDNGDEETFGQTLNVVRFENDTYRAKLYSHIIEDDGAEIYFFCPENAQGTITIILEEFNEDEEEFVPAGEFSYKINSTMYNKWTVIHELHGDNYIIDFRVDDSVVSVEREGLVYDESLSYQVDTDNNLNPGDAVAYIGVPYDMIDSNFTFNITCGDKELFSIRSSELEGREYEWHADYGSFGAYNYPILLEEVNSFDSVSDKDSIIFTLYTGEPIDSRWITNNRYVIQKTDDIIKLYKYEELRIDLVKIVLPGDLYLYIQTSDDEEEQRNAYNVSQEDATFAGIVVPDELNITETAVVQINYEDYVLTKELASFDYDYDYNCLGKVYHLNLGILNPENLKGDDLINITLTSNDEVIGYRTIVCSFNEDGLLEFGSYDVDSIDLDFHFGEIGHSEFGMGEHDGRLMILTIPEYFNITEGAIQLIADDGTILFSKSLSEFEEGYFGYEDEDGCWEYRILDNITEFDYSCLPEGVNFTVTFTYGNTTLSFDRGVRKGDWIHKVNTPENVANLFKITVSDDILCNGEDNVIIIEATDDANRQSIDIDIGGGYFVVYVNGQKVEDLGRIFGGQNKSDLYLTHLCSVSDGISKLYLYLPDLNITDNGIYNVRITHRTDSDTEVHQPMETELFNKNVTLTSNIKVNYQNASTRLFTGYGIDPVLLYLDTYYGDINSTNGTITVLNSDNATIFTKNIKDLKYDDGRYILSYSDFENKNFGDSITVLYGNGNERSGETTLDVLWKDVDSNDFTPNVTENVEDYYGNFVNLNIPDLLTTGQIIVTIKFKNNHGSNISNMNVTTDFDSQAVYKFNIADIKANYDNNDFALSLSDLGFYEINGDYDVDVKFTADGINELDVTSNTLKVEFLDDIIIAVNETSRYACELPFAGVRVYEPISAYGELYIDGELYSHKTFEKGLITFISSASWAPGMHAAEVRVCDSEFGSVLNSTTFTFETLTQTDDVNVSMDKNVKENENVIVTINVIKAGNVTVQIDNGNKITYALVEGQNNVDLGVLSYGNHTVWISYNATLDDGNVSFYNNYLTLFVGDDGRWLSLPEPLVLDDDDTIKMAFGDDAEGYVLVFIDGEQVANITLVNGSAEFALTDFVFGDHKYGEHT